MQENYHCAANEENIFKYPLGVFVNKFNNKDKTIFNILLDSNIKYIQFCISNNNEYFIFRYEQYYYKHYAIIDDNNEFSYSNFYKYYLYKTIYDENIISE